MTVICDAYIQQFNHKAMVCSDVYCLTLYVYSVLTDHLIASLFQDIKKHLKNVFTSSRYTTVITYTDYNTHTSDVQYEWGMLIEMAVPIVKEHISSTEVLKGVRYMWTAVLVVYAHPLCFQL